MICSDPKYKLKLQSPQSRSHRPL